MKQVVITEQVSLSITLLDSALLLGAFPHSILNAFRILRRMDRERRGNHRIRRFLREIHRTGGEAIQSRIADLI